jgi:hypothetical protein
MADNRDEMRSDWMDEAYRQQLFEQLDQERLLRDSLHDDIARELEWQRELDDIRERNDLYALFTLDQLDLLHHLQVPDPVDDAFYEELRQDDLGELVRRVEREERKVRESTGKAHADQSGWRTRLAVLLHRQHEAERSPTLQRVANILCASGDQIGQYVNVGTAVSICAFLLPSLVGTPTALVLTASMVVAKMGAGPFCKRWRSTKSQRNR